MLPFLIVLAVALSTKGDSVATATLQLERAKPPYFNANAEYMSLGPPGATIPDTASRRGWRFENPVTHRLRVTLGSNERISWMLIDDIVAGRADTRTVSAEYMFSPVGESTRDLWTALQGAPRVLGSEPTGPPIVWLSPTSFSWITRSDTLVFEQKADSVFQVAVRARIR